jgi:fructose-specific phosphotransferase system IIC component
MPEANAVTEEGAAVVEADCSVMSTGAITAAAATPVKLVGATIVAGAIGVGAGINNSYKLFDLF